VYHDSQTSQRQQQAEKGVTEPSSLHDDAASFFLDEMWLLRVFFLPLSFGALPGVCVFLI
jgi:hypothetical protein